MKGYFKKPGKYGKSQYDSVVVSKEDVKEKKVFDIDSFYAEYFIESKVFVVGDFQEEEKELDITSMTVKQLKQYADENEIDIQDASKKEELIEIIQAV